MCKPPFHQLLHPFPVSSSSCCLGVQVHEFICVTFVVFKPEYGVCGTGGVKGLLSNGKSLNNLLYKSGCNQDAWVGDKREVAKREREGVRNIRQQLQLRNIRPRTAQHDLVQGGEGWWWWVWMFKSKLFWAYHNCWLMRGIQLGALWVGKQRHCRMTVFGMLVSIIAKWIP